MSLTKPKDLYVMIDSGAFSALMRGAKIDLDLYAKWIHKNHHLFDVAVNLDVIPGKGGSPEQAARDSFTNWRALHERDCEVMGVYHYGEDVRWLMKIIDTINEDKLMRYVGLGGIAKAPSTIRRSWLDRVMHICNDNKIKVHLFGVSSIAVVQKFKPHSFDSISSQKFAATGNTCFLVDGKMHKLHTGQISPTRVKVVNKLAAPLGLDADLLRDWHWARARMAAWTFDNATNSRFITGLSTRDYVRKSFLPAGLKRWLFSYYSITVNEISLRDCLKAYHYYHTLLDQASQDLSVIDDIKEFTDGKFDWSSFLATN